MVSEPSIGTNSVVSIQYWCSELRHLRRKYIRLLRILCSIGKQNKYYRESINAFSMLSSHIPVKSISTQPSLEFHKTDKQSIFWLILTSLFHTWAEIFFQLKSRACWSGGPGWPITCIIRATPEGGHRHQGTSTSLVIRETINSLSSISDDLENWNNWSHNI